MHTITRRRWLLITGATGVAAGIAPVLGAGADDGIEMVEIPGGSFLMGTTPEQVEAFARRYRVHSSWLGGEAPQRGIDLPPFRIDKYPVTNRQYAAFCRATGHAPPPHWSGNGPRPELLDHPVTHVNRADARACARWSGKRLPTEAEWEKAARGADGRAFPWGDAFDPEACQFDRGGPQPPAGTAPVTAHPRGASPYGVMDLCGNAAEWCDDGPGPGSAFVKGGSWLTLSPLHLRCAARGLSGFDNNRLAFVGFRCVRVQ